MSNANFLKDRFAIIITGSVTLLATFAWQSALDGLFKGPCGAKNAGILCHFHRLGPFVFAILLTLLSVGVTILFSKISEKVALQKREAARLEMQKMVQQMNSAQCQ